MIVQSELSYFFEQTARDIDRDGIENGMSVCSSWCYINEQESKHNVGYTPGSK